MTTVSSHQSEFDQPRDVLALPAAIQREIVAHMQANLPNEGCGLLAESISSGDLNFYAGVNVEQSPVRYSMDPAEVIGFFKRMRERNEEMVAIVHSHPATAPVPSRTDLSQAYYPEALLLIVSFRNTEPELAAWRLDGAEGAWSVQPVELEMGTAG